MDRIINSFPLERMKWHQKLAFGLGHIFNDLCAAMWFSLLLIFFQNIVHFPNKIAGYLLLWGQAVDAVTTPLVGYESDRVSGCHGLGKRKSWHLFGSLAVLFSFPFIFTRCIGCSQSSSWYQFVYYLPFVAIFQIGWASVQIAHMSLISHLTEDTSEKTELSGIRNAGTLLSSIIVFCSGWGFYNRANDSAWEDSDATRFMILMFIVVGVGSFCTLIFHLLLRENPGDHHEGHLVTNMEFNSDTMYWSDWLKEPQFWLVGGMYMLSRLVVNVSGTYWPFYVLETLHMAKMYMLIIPLVVNVTGFFVSLLMRLISDKIGRQMTLLVGVLFTLGGCLWLFFINKTTLLVIGPAILIGAGGSVLIVTSLAMTTDIIGMHKMSGAFVFGAMSFSDKLSNGLAVVFIQQFYPCPASVDCDQEPGYYRLIMVYVLSGFACLLLLILFVTWPQKLGRLRKFAGASEVTAHDNGEDHDDEDERRPLTSGLHRRAYVSIVNDDHANLPEYRPTDHQSIST